MGVTESQPHHATSVAARGLVPGPPVRAGAQNNRYMFLTPRAVIVQSLFDDRRINRGNPSPENLQGSSEEQNAEPLCVRIRKGTPGMRLEIEGPAHFVANCRHGQKRGEKACVSCVVVGNMVASV